MDKQSQDTAALLNPLAKTNTIVKTSLHRAIRNHKLSKEYDSQTGGLDFLRAKNGLLLSYLIDLTMLLKLRCRTPSSDDSDDDKEDTTSETAIQSRQECVQRLVEMKAALEKMRPLEKKLRYQIDKLLALSTLGAGTFAAEGREKEVEDDIADEMNGGADPLSFKPDLSSMMKSFEDNNANEAGGNHPNEEDDGSDDDDASTEGKIDLDADDADAQSSNVYKAPRLQSVPFALENEQKMAQMENQRNKQRDRMQRSELAEVVRAQFTDAPEEEDIRGGAMLGKQREVSRKLAARDADIQEFEETQMIRLTMGKKEKKERKKMMREEMSNLGALSEFGNIAAGVDDAFGRDEGGRPQGGGSYKMKGMRKRKVEVFDDARPSSNKKKASSKKKSKQSNQYQNALYGRR
jgi:U3 small nucleolar ribonucleoprotein protein LCP5